MNDLQSLRKQMLSYISTKVDITIDNEEGFLIKDLFTGDEWNRLPKSTRIQLGQAFLKEVKAGLISNVIMGNKGSNNQQWYKKVN